MSVVKINAVEVPAGMEPVFEERFAKRAGSVESSEGFEEFQLLRPVEGSSKYLVYTRWATEAAFEAWRAGNDFAAAHRGDGPAAPTGPQASAPAGPTAELWSFEVLERVTPPAG